MKNVKRILSVLLATLLLMSVLPMAAVSAAGTKDDPIDAATKWFGYGADTYLLNPSIAEGTTDGIWYTLTAENDGILFLEHSYKNVDYTITVTVNGMVYVGGCVDGVPYNRPIHTYPLQTGDVATVQIVTKDAAAGTVYANMNVIDNSASNAIKVKSEDYPIYVAAGQTVYFQDDSLQALYATKTAILSGDSVEGVTFYNVTNNSTTGATTMKANNDTDGDGQIELSMGGSAGSAGAPAVKPAWAVENNSSVDKCFTLSLVAGAHECKWDDDLDADCNSCGAIREVEIPCAHEYFYACDATCMICGEYTNPDAAHAMTFVPAVDATCANTGNIAFYTCEHCGGCWDNEAGLGMPLNRMMIITPATGEHEYLYACDATCMICGEYTNPDAAHSMTFVPAVDATCVNTGNIAFYTCDHCGGCWDNEAGSGMPLNRMMIITPATGEHVYDNDKDADCNDCGAIREIVIVVPGDANGDGKLNNRDLGILQQYLNDWVVEISFEAADLNGDGRVNNRDLGLLQQLLNN